MGNAITADTSEAVEMIPTDMKKIITNTYSFIIKFTHEVCITMAYNISSCIAIHKTLEWAVYLLEYISSASKKYLKTF